MFCPISSSTKLKLFSAVSNLFPNKATAVQCSVWSLPQQSYNRSVFCLISSSTKLQLFKVVSNLFPNKVTAVQCSVQFFLKPSYNCSVICPISSPTKLQLFSVLSNLFPNKVTAVQCLVRGQMDDAQWFSCFWRGQTDRWCTVNQLFCTGTNR